MKTAIDVLLDRAVGASTLFNRYEAAKVQHIIECVAEVGEKHAEFYAQWAVAETGYGNVEDNKRRIWMSQPVFLPAIGPRVLSSLDPIIGKISFNFPSRPA